MIAFDLQAIQSVGNSERGIARFVTEIVRHLVAGPHAGRVDLFLWNDRLPWSERVGDLGLGDRLRSFSEVAGHEVDVLHVNSPFEVPSVVDLVPPVRANRIVSTCYDLIPYLYPEQYLTNRFVSAAYRRRLGLIATSDAVVTDSQSAADDVIEHLGVDPDRVTVIGAGVSPQFVPSTQPLDERISALRAEWPSLRARYVLVPTAADWRKNSEGAIQAFADLPGDVRDLHQLVLFCRLTDDQRAALEAFADEAGVADRVIFTGFVPDELLVALYQSAELVFVPTYYEGFGLPVLEARRCGARVMCSNSSSLPEVLVDERARFNPFDRASMSDALLRGLTDDALATVLDRVPDPPFDWDRAADRLVGVYERLGERSVAPSPDRRVRVGVVASLLPSSGDGAARAREEVLPALADDDRFSVTIFPAVHEPAGLLDYPGTVRPFFDLFGAWLDGDVDVIVHAVDSRPHRLHISAMHLVPGHVVLLGDAHPELPLDRALSVTRWGDGPTADFATLVSGSRRGEPAAST